MKPENIIYALNDIDGGFIREAHGEAARRKRPVRRLVALIAAVIALMAMTATAFAAEEIAGWFRNYFAGNTEDGLTPGQIEYIEENEQIVTEPQTQNTYTLELKSAITDGNAAYIILGIAGPEDAVLTRTDIEGYSTDSPSILFGNNKSDYLVPADGQPVWGYISYYPVEDNDGLDSTQDIMIVLVPTYEEEDGNPLAPGSVWNLHIENLIAQYHNTAFIEDFYQNHPGENVTEEHLAKMYPQVTLAEGVWDFEITFAGSDSVELVSQPITVQGCIGYQEDGTEVYEDVQLTTFTLGALGAKILYDAEDYAVEFSGGESHLCYAVLKDGSRIPLRSSLSSIGETYLLADSPIVLDEVDHVLLADGTKLTAP